MPKWNDIYFKWSVILIGTVLLFIFFAFFATKFGETELTVNLHDKEISIRTAQLKSSAPEVRNFDPTKFYVDSTSGFSFARPTGKSWSDPKPISGIDAVLKAKGAVLTRAMRERQRVSLALHPLGKMILHQKVLRITSGKPINIKTTDQTTNQLFDSILAKMKKDASSKGTVLSAKIVTNIRKQILGFNSINFSNEFTVSVFDKANAAGVPVKLSLPNFFMTMGAQVGLMTDRLVANKDSILLGMSINLKQVTIDGRDTDVRIDRWMLFTETTQRFYLVEIAFSPETEDSIEVWKELRQMIDSFRVFKT